MFNALLLGVLFAINSCSTFVDGCLQSLKDWEPKQNDPPTWTPEDLPTNTGNVWKNVQNDKLNQIGLTTNYESQEFPGTRKNRDRYVPPHMVIVLNMHYALLGR